jgi:hypothetical protein
MQKNLSDFVAHARKKGMDHATIRMLLLSNGWKEKDVAEALTAETLDMPVPVPPDRGGAREAFLHLLNFAAFYTAIIAVTVLYFTYINRLFPDPALDPSYRYDTPDFSGIRWSLASVIVAFPLFLWISRILLREMRAVPEKASSIIRRWLTYLTLFLAAITIMVDGMTLIYNLLEGELSIRFLLKVFVVLALAGLTFTYYFLSLQRSPRDS